MDPSAAMLPEAHAQTLESGGAGSANARRFNWFFARATLLGGWSTVALLAWIASSIGLAAWPAAKAFGFGFLRGQQWVPNADVYGALPLIYGTAVSSALALVLATPLGVLIVIF